MTLVAPGICRFAVHGLIHDRPWVNVLDMDLDPAVLDTRHDVINDQARVILNRYFDNIRPLVASAWSCTGVSWVDLNSEGGETGTRSTTPEHTVPFAGSRAGETASGQVAMLVTKRTASARGRRNGRIYVPGIGEASIAGNVQAAPDLVTCQTNLAAFLTGINQTGGLSLDYTSHLVVVHTTQIVPGGTPEFVGSDNVTALEPQARLATQRRRLRA